MSSMMIAPFTSGLVTDLEPWQAPPDSFSQLNNVHVKHNYIQKRAGEQFFGSLQPAASTIAIDTITQANPGQVTTSVAHGYSTGDRVFITSATGMTEVNNKIYEIIVLDTTNFTLGIDTSGFTAYTGAGTSALVDSDTDRVMGIYKFIDNSGSPSSTVTTAFNARSAYVFNGSTNSFDQLVDNISASATIFSSGVTDYVWGEAWQSSNISNRLYFTNGLQWDGSNLDGIYYYPGTGGSAFVTRLVPSTGGGNTLYGGKLLFTIGQRLIVLSTFEDPGTGVQAFPQRARWCAKQNPSPSTTPGGWDDTVAGGGDYTDAATGDEIVSARHLQNQLIVFFTNSVWSLVPTSDPNRAFRWQKINDFRACDGKMASVEYDRYVPALGIRGITATDGIETKRIDNNIQDFVVDSIDTSNFSKTFCSRSYSDRRWWTLYVSGASTEVDKALVYDDDTGAFSTYDISLNVLGYGKIGFDYGLNDFTIANGFFNPDGTEKTLADYGSDTIEDYFYQENQEVFLGGDIYGNIFILEQGGSDYSASIPTTLFSAAWNPYIGDGKEALMPYFDLYIDTDLSTQATLEFYKDNDDDPYTSQEIDFLPNLNFVAGIDGATAVNPVSVSAPEHGLSTGDIIFIYGVQGMTSLNSGSGNDDSEDGPGYSITVVDADNFTLDNVDGSAYPAYTGGGAIYLRPFYRTKTWKRAYAGGIGFQHRVKITTTGSTPYRIHAFKPMFKPRGKRVIN